MFKQRILTVLKRIGYLLMYILIVVVVMFLMALFIIYVPENIANRILTVIQWVLGIILGFLISIAIISSIWQFVNWIAIEPYKEYKRVRSAMQNESKNIS